MRTYAKNFVFKKTVSYQQRQARLATEWDIRLDVSEQLTPENIINNIKAASDEWSYALVSGVEFPDKEISTNAFGNGKAAPAASVENHVHLCIVLYVPKQRCDVLKMVRGPRKLGDEYCAPRNNKFPYAGWVIHHAKPAFKLDGEPDIRYENGDLPMDPYTTEWALRIKSMLKKFGSPQMELRFESYTRLLTKNKIQEQIEALQMQLEEVE